MAAVRWLQGPWRTQADPHAALLAPGPTSTPAATPSPYERLTNGEAGGGFGGFSASQPEATGPLNSSERAAVSLAAGNVPGAVAGYFGAPAAVQTAANVVGNLTPSPTKPLGAVNFVSTLAGWLGARREANPYADLMDPQDIAGLRDLGGVYGMRADEARAAIDAFNAAVAQEDTGYASPFSSRGGLGPGASPAGWGGASVAPGVGPAGLAEGSVFGPGSTSMNDTTGRDTSSPDPGQNSPGSGERSGETGGGGGGDSGDGGGTGGCFVRGSRVALWDDGTKPIEDIAVGDHVRSWDEAKECWIEGTVAEVFPSHSRVFVILTLSSGVDITCTPRHRFLTEKREWVQAVDLQNETTLLCGDRIMQGRSSEVAEDIPVWNFSVSPCRTYVIEGQVVHNVKAMGGVVRAFRGPKRAIFGEAGPEQAIFIPQTMMRPGIQGRELQVRRALMRAQRMLGMPKRMLT